MPAKRKFLISKEQLRRDYDEVKSLYKLADRYGVHRLTILVWMKKYGIPRAARIPRKFFITPEQLDQDYKNLRSTSKIAQKYGISKKLVLRYMQRHGIVRNKRKGVPIDILKKMSIAGLTTKEAGRVFGISTIYIARIAKKNGFKFNDPYHPGYITRDRGYIMLYAPKHPFANVRKCVMEHRLVCEKQLGRYLTPDEVVHHINRIVSDNRIENLVVMSKEDHVRLHSREGRKKHNDH